MFRTSSIASDTSYISIYCLWCNYILRIEYLLSLVLRGLFTFLFERNAFRGYDFTPDLIEVRKIKADAHDILPKW